MTTRTAKRLAAAILRSDMEIVTGYWLERHPNLEGKEEEIQEAMDAILKPFEKRLDTIAKDITVYGDEE